MPLLKPIAGHTGCAGIKRYLEKGGRALGVHVMNFAWQEEHTFEAVSDTPFAPPAGWLRVDNGPAEGNRVHKRQTMTIVKYVGVAAPAP